MELQQLQNQLQAPVVEKAQKAVETLAKAKGVAGVFEKASLLFVDPAQLIDLTPEARTALNIPEGRTLEQLQQELAAKAQAAQAM
jgi:Skp family chaperone for outer membrane proteins